MSVESDLNETYGNWLHDMDSPEKTSAYLKAARPVINGALKSYAPGMERDLATKAKIMTLDISKKYDPTKGMKLRSYLLQNMRSLGREYKNRLNPVKLPEKLILDRNRIHSAEADFTARKGREPSAQELAEMTSLSIKRIERARASGRVVPDSLMTTEEGDGPSSLEASASRMWADYVYHDLDPVDQKIFEWSTGYGGAGRLKKGEIAEKLKISAPAVSSRIKRIVTKMEEGMALS